MTLLAVNVGAISASAATTWTDPPRDVTLQGADLLSGSASVHGDMVELRLQTSAAPFPARNTYDVTWCLDTDRNASTGRACGSASGADLAISLREPGAGQELFRLLGLPGLDVCSMLSFDPATNTMRLLVPLSSFGGDDDFAYTVGISFGGSFGINESSGWQSTVSEPLDAWSGAPFCEPPRLDPGPRLLPFIAEVGKDDPLVQPFMIRNRGPTLNWTLSTSADWLSLDRTADRGSETLYVSADPFGLAPGIYTDEIVIASDETESLGPPTPVTLSVVERVSLVQVRSFSTERFGSPVGIAYDPTTHRLWLAGDAISEITNRGRRISSFASDAYGGSEPTGIAVDPDTGELWIADDALDTVFRVSRRGVELSAFPTGVNSVPAGIGFDPELGDLFTADAGGAADEVFTRKTDGSLERSFDLNELGLAEFGSSGVVFDPETAHLFVTDSHESMLYEIDTQGVLAQVYDLASLGIETPRGVALDAARRHLWIVDGANGRVVELAFEGEGQPYALPVSLDVDPASCTDLLSLSQDTLTVAVAGSPDLDVRDIDAQKVRLEGVEPLKKSRSDKTSPTEFAPPGSPQPECPAPDGQQDYVFKFSAAAVLDALESRLGREVVPGERVLLNLTGKLRSTAQRAPVRGMGWANVTE